VTLKKLPDIDDDAAMIARGRRSALMSCRNDACEELRDACVAVQSAALEDLGSLGLRVVEVGERLRTIALLWGED
jgi:hypothetical protein